VLSQAGRRQIPEVNNTELAQYPAQPALGLEDVAADAPVIVHGSKGLHWLCDKIHCKDFAEMPTPLDKLRTIQLLIADICGLHPRLEELIRQFGEIIDQVERASQAGVSKNPGDYWELIAFKDSLVRVNLFLEQNFNYVETIGVLAVARYLLELTVWLKLLKMDGRYGLVYYREMLKKNLEFYTELRNNAKLEISFLRNIGAQEQSLIESRLAETMQITDEEARKQALRRLSDDVTQEVDQTASRKFSLYGEQAQTNGYDYQAYQVETKVLPKISKSVMDLEQKLDTFDRDTPPDIRDLAQKKWRWKDQANLAGMKDEYDFIYAYASRLLHATPASLTTNQKNLEPDEMRLFVKYIRVRLLDMVEMAEELIATNPTVVH
jgi:hypothetical protein